MARGMGMVSTCNVLLSDEGCLQPGGVFSLVSLGVFIQNIILTLAPVRRSYSVLALPPHPHTNELNVCRSPP